MKQQKLFAAILCAATPLAYAANSDTMNEVVVTAARMSQPLDQTIAHATVLNEQEIRQSGAPDVPTLLRSLAGIEVVQSGGLGKVSSTFMRGTESDHVLILLDGVRVNSATAGPTALEHIMLDNIERIEVVRGNVSSLYGSDAIGGVIQLFTKRGHGAPAFNASAGLGSHGTQRLTAGVSGGVNDTSFSAHVANNKTNGMSAINTSVAQTNPDKDGYDNTTFNAQVQHAINAGNLLSASWFSTRGKSQYDQVVDAWFNPNAATDSNNTRANIDKLSLTSDNQINEKWNSQLRLARGTDDSQDIKNDVQKSRLKTTSDQIVWQNDVSIAKAHKLNLSFEHLGQSISVQDIATANPYTQTKRSVNSLLGGYLGEFGAHQLQVNLRQDRYSDFGTANTSLLGYGWQFSEGWRATATVSNAFKAPTFNDLYRPSWGGNPNLKPEHANNREVGLRYASARQQFDMIYFDNRIRDLISGWPLLNNNQARIDGLELNYAGQFGDTGVKAALTLQDPRDTQTGLALLRRATSYGNVGLTQKLGAWQLGGEWQYSGAREDNHITAWPTQRVVMPAYDILNFTASYALDKQLKLSLRADNLFEKDYMLAHGYNTLGRTLSVGVNYQP